MLTFFWSNFKLISYVIIASILALAGWKLYSVIESNGKYKIIIEQQEEEIKIKNNQIDNLRDIMKLTSDIINERDQELNSLTKKNNTNNLGPDSSDSAPLSLKNYFKRLEN